jgi:uncharacterized membrane protein YuzA (DUF378 family)
MANYSIIGGDGKQYGPVTDADVNQWIAEGRLNAQSLAKSEGDAEFRPLAQFPEFAATLAPQAVPDKIAPILAIDTGVGRSAALTKVKIPAIALIITAAINILFGLIGLFSRPDMQQFNSDIQQLNNPQLEAVFQKIIILAQGPLAIANSIFELAVSMLILIGAIKMLSLRGYGFAFAAAILATVPCLTPCIGYILGVAFGIWALIVLKKPEVKKHFN